MSKKTFERIEKKYVVNNDQKNQLISILKKYMDYDPFCLDGNTYCIYNIYCDTDDNRIIQQSISKPVFKEKLRIRSYGEVLSNSMEAFIELKRKINGVVVKRRAFLPLKNIDYLVNFKQLVEATDYINFQVGKEIIQYLNLYKPKQKVFIGYERLAFFDKNDTSFRLTFDNNICTRRSNLSLSFNHDDKLLLPNNKNILEVKFQGSLPIWLVQAFSKLNIYSTGFSKYGEEYRQYKNN